MDPTPLPRNQRLRRLFGAVITLGFAALGAAAVMVGVALISDGRADSAAAPPAPLAVSVVSVTPEAGYSVTRRFLGQIEAASETSTGFELGGRVSAVLAEEGDTVAAGAMLARLDTSSLIPERAALEAELAALGADAELARLTLARNDALTERGFRSVAAQDEARLALARTEAGMAALRARIAGVDVLLEKSVLVAPFAARVGSRLADPGQTVAAGQPVFVLFEAAPAQLRVGLPAELAAALRPGDTARVVVGDAVLDGTVLRIRPDLDPVTRSRQVLVDLPPHAVPVLGQTAELLVTQTIPEPGYWAPLAALREGVRGSWSVLAIEETEAGDVVRTAGVEVIHSDGVRVFLRGELPPGARIVAEAPDRVAPGQPVLAQPARQPSE